MSSLNTYTIYMSLVAGSVISQKNLQRMTIILDAQKIKYEQVDISLEENSDAKETMKTKSKAKAPLMTPQIFLNGEYICDYDQFFEWVEYEELKEHLK